ncbi:MAG: hypothetical protein AAFX09_11715 [Pseudomonadota bacterium]
MLLRSKYAKARPEARLARTEDIGSVAGEALDALARRRAGTPAPSAFSDHPHPWTLDFARLLARRVDDRLSAGAPWPGRHLISCDGAAGRSGMTSHAPGERLLAPAWLHDVAWRVEREDGSALADTPLVARLVWRGGWPQLVGACDAIAACRARVRLVCANADPARAVGEMTLAEALAFRISAFAPAGDRVVLAFYGGDDAGAERAGFTLFDYACGERDVKPRR